MSQRPKIGKVCLAPLRLGAKLALSVVALVVLASCNTAGELPQGPVTPIVPPAGAVATRSAQPTSAPAVGTTPAAVQPTASAAPLPVRQPSAQGGAQIFAQRCAPCHGAGGKGDGAQSQQIVAQMGGKLPDFTDSAYARAAQPTDWFTTISTGRMTKGMPPFSQSLTDEQRWDMVAFLFSLSTPQEQLDRGKVIYADKCVTCHGDTGKSNTPGLPDLSDAAKMSAQSQADLDAVIANGRGAMPGFADLSQADRFAAADYVRSLSMALGKASLPTGQSSIVGTLANGTAGASIPAHQPLTLYALTQDGSSILFTRTVTSDVGGQFAFDQLDPSPTTMYAIQTQYLKAYYTSEPLTFAHGGVTLTVPITVYETTTDAATVRVEQMHMFFDFASGSTTVGQLFIVSNSGDRAYIGTDGTSLHLPLPPGATNVRFQDGELGGRYQSVSDGFADTEAIAPGVGTVQILVSYDLPYDGKKLDVEFADGISRQECECARSGPRPQAHQSTVDLCRFAPDAGRQHAELCRREPGRRGKPCAANQRRGQYRCDGRNTFRKHKYAVGVDCQRGVAAGGSGHRRLCLAASTAWSRSRKK